MKKYLATFFCTIIIISLCANAGAFSRPEDHVVVKGAAFTNLLNTPIDRIRMFSLKNGKIEAIPFQIDKVDIDGAFLFNQKEADEKAKKRKDKYMDALDDRKNHSAEALSNLKTEAEWTDDMDIFDSGDELVFMAWDLGKKAAPGMFPNADKIEELSITNPVDSDTGYAYVAVFNSEAPALSLKNYVRYNPKGDEIDTDFYNVDFEDNNPFCFKEARHKNKNGDAGPNYMDRVKMRFKMDIKWFITLNFDENNANGKLLAYKSGPVRLIKRTLFWLDLLSIPVMPSVAMDYLFYPNGLISPSVLDVTYDPETFINEGSFLLFALDFSDVNNGSKVYTEKTPAPVTLDGIMSPEEKSLDLKNQNWYVVYNELQTGFITQLVFDKRLKNVKTDIKYIDDKTINMKPESEPGQHFIGFQAAVKQFTKGKYEMNMYTYMNKSWTRGMEKRYLQFISHPLRAQSKKIK